MNTQSQLVKHKERYPHSDDDELTMALAGAVLMTEREGNMVPGQLLDGGEHFDDDHDRRVRRRRPPHPPHLCPNVACDSNRYWVSKLPRENLCK